MMSADPNFASYFGPVVIGIAFILVLSWLWSMMSQPGPWGVPVLGYYPFLRSDFHAQLHEMTKKYGPIYTINLLGQTFVYAGNFRVLREMYCHQNDVFYNRSSKPSMLYESFKKGLFCLEDNDWRVQRRFFTQTMRQIGLAANKEEFKGPIAEAVANTVKWLKESKGEAAVDLVGLLNKECTSVIIRLFLGNQVSPEMAKRICESYLKVLICFTDTNILLVGPIAKYLALQWVKGYDEMKQGLDEMKATLQEIVDYHKEAFDIKQQPRDFIDCFLKERVILEEKGDPTSKYYTDESLVGTLIQTYGDGSAAIGLFTACYLHELSHYADIQDAVHDEIVSVIGTERLPTIDDRHKLPLTNSTFKELLRVSHMISVLPSLECTRDTTVYGCKIKQGTIVLTNGWGINNDPEMFENPNRFDHTRFLPYKPKTEQPLVFGLGKRACAGEGIVVSQMFSIIAAIMQHFKLVPVKEMNNTTSGHYQVCAIAR